MGANKLNLGIFEKANNQVVIVGNNKNWPEAEKWFKTLNEKSEPIQPQDLGEETKGDSQS